MAEFIASLAILSDNGSILLKMFTFYETSSIAMLYVLSCCFQDLHIFKPATSKEGNSEVYVIGTGYKKHVVSDEFIEKMITNFRNESKVLLALKEIPDDFVKEVVEAARFFMNQQVSVIEMNIRTFKKFDKMEHDRIKLLKLLLVEDYVKLYKMKSIREDQKILHGLQINNDINLNVRVHSGSHSERIEFFHLSRADRVQVLFDRLKHFYDLIFQNALSTSCVAHKLYNPEMVAAEFIQPIYGKRIEKVVSSKFFLVSLVKYLIELRAFLEEPVGGSYDGERFTVKGNHMRVNTEYFWRAPSYDEYEKDITMEMLKLIDELQSDSFTIEGLPLFTQFLVSVILFLSVFVFEEVHLKRSAGVICFKSMTPNGKSDLKILTKIVSKQSLQAKGLLGICDTKLLFAHSQEFYKSVIDYNNHICLKFCSFYLNISKNL